MAVYKTANAIGEREDLSDVITRIDPAETQGIMRSRGPL